jgi:hypothetical protein
MEKYIPFVKVGQTKQMDGFDIAVKEKNFKNGTKKGPRNQNRVK